MKTVPTFLSICLLTILAACKEPEPSAPLVRYQVNGKLVYRSACLGETAIPFPGVADRQGPLLYLTDDDGLRVSMLVRPESDGSFTIPYVRPGDYRLRLQAGELQQFWRVTSVTSLPVSVSSSDASIGIVCADSMPIANPAVNARWAGDWSSPTSSGTLYVWSAAGSVTFTAEGDTRNGRADLAPEWDEPSWDVTGATTITGRATDMLGSWTNLRQHVVRRPFRSATQLMTGWMDFGTALTAEDMVSDTEGDAAWSMDENGLHAAGAADTSNISMHAAMKASYAITAPATFMARMNLTAVPQATSIELGLVGTSSPAMSARLTRTSVGFVLSAHGPNGELLGQVTEVNVALSADEVLYLKYDPATRELQAGFGTDSPAYLLSVHMREFDAERFMPYVGITRIYPDTGEGIDVLISGLYTDQRTTQVRLPAPPGVFHGVTYDPTGCNASAPAYAFVDNKLYAANNGVVTFSIDHPKTIARALLYQLGCPITVYTDMDHEAAVERGGTLDDWTAEVMVPISDGQAYLY